MLHCLKDFLKPNTIGLVVLVLCFANCAKDEPDPVPEPQQEPSALPSFTIEITSVNGSTNLTKTAVEQGEKVELTAQPDAGYKFVNWSGDIIDTVRTLNLEVSKNLNLVANFKLDTQRLNENVPVIVSELVDDSGYILAVEFGRASSYLVNREGEKLKTWEFNLTLGHDLQLLDDGSLLGIFKAPNASIRFGGYGGIIRIIDPMGAIRWEYTISDENQISHHDVEMLPNGNIMVLVWERIAQEVAAAHGVAAENDIFTEKLVEINPATNEIVWQWRSWEHIIQNVDPTLAVYGDPLQHKEKINIAYNNNATRHPFIAQGDLMHANGIAYLPSKDLLALSINFYGEVWFIDHSTTTSEAKGSTGGNFNKGGDLIYRLGNVNVFDNGTAKAVLDNHHHPTFIENGNDLSVLVYSNNTYAEQSSVKEFKLPDFSADNLLSQNAAIQFSYTHPQLFHAIVSGAQRLPNGNTLICEGDSGFWEVTPSGDIVWRYINMETGFWRGLYYDKNSAAIKNALKSH